MREMALQSKKKRMAAILGLVLLLLLGSSIAATTTAHKVIGSIGGITDCTTRVGREERIAMEMAVHDFYNLTGYKLALSLWNLAGKFDRTPFAAIDLVKTQQVEAIVGTLTLQEATLVTEMDDTTDKVTIVSLSTSALIPLSMRTQVLPLIHMGQCISVQIRCIAATIGYFRWQKVIVIYEDKNSYISDLSIITLLSDALRDTGAEIEHYSAFPAISSLSDPKTTIQEELKKLMGKQSKVFIVVESSLSFTALLFEQSNRMGMMEKGHVWIAADAITSLLDSMKLSTISSMEGVVGFKTHFLDTVASYKDFKTRFRRKFQSEYPEEEEHPDPSVFALRAYDAVWAVAKGMERLQETRNSRTLLSSILSSNFKGLSSDIRFVNSKLAHVPSFRMVNVVGKMYREMGFWSPKFGFSKNLVKQDIEEKGINSIVSSNEVLHSVYWPGGNPLIPVGLLETTSSGNSGKPLRIAVQEVSISNEFVMVTRDENQIPRFSGFSVHVFREAMLLLRTQLTHSFIPFNGSYDAMVKRVNEKEFDAAIGDRIEADWSQVVEFPQSYIESGLSMVVPLKPDKSGEPWMFMKPFTKGMWCLLAAMSMLTGFVIWVVEHRSNSDFRGPPMHQVGNVLWFSFTTLFLGQREWLRSNLSRIVLAPWLFLILIVSASFLASLTSMMTASSLELGGRLSGGVGCDGELTLKFLVDVLHFRSEKIKTFASVDEFANAILNRDISAVFLPTPRAKILVARYCKDLAIAEPTYQFRGFHFVFPKNSSLALDISEAVQRLTKSEGGQQLEDTMLSLLKCSASIGDTRADQQSLGIAPFAGLFIISGGASVVVLFIRLTCLLKRRWQTMIYILAKLMGGGFWKRAAILPAQNHVSGQQYHIPV